MGVSYSCAVADKQDSWDDAGEERILSVLLDERILPVVRGSQGERVLPVVRGPQEVVENEPNFKVPEPQWKVPPGRRLTMMMFGMTGSGKSSMGNLIAGSDVFAAGDDTASITNMDSVMRWEAEDASLILLDTIGLGDTEIDQEKVVASLRDAVESAKDGVDILAYVMQNARITDDAIMRLIYVTECLWGQECLPNLYVVVTRASKYAHGREEADAWIQRQVEVSWRFKYIYSIVGNDPKKFIFIDNPGPNSGEPGIENRRKASRDALMKMCSLHQRDAISPLTQELLKPVHEVTQNEWNSPDSNEFTVESKENEPETNQENGPDSREFTIESKENEPESNQEPKPRKSSATRATSKRVVRRKSSKEIATKRESVPRQRRFPTIRLWAFDTSFWRPECIRMCLHFGGVPFEDKRVSPQEFRSSGMLVFGTYLEVTGWPINQMYAMAAYAGRLSGFYPSDPAHAAKVDEALAALTDASFCLTTKTGREDQEGKSSVRAEMMSPGGQLHNLFSGLQALLVQNGRSGLFAGTSVTVADLAVWRAVIWLCSGIVVGVDPEYLANSFPELVRLYHRVERLPKVQEWKLKYDKFYASPEAHWKELRPYPPATFLAEPAS
mmetsp:Transcript_54861/g.102957  ORF Transcript_54861/g.102957 Transcript_54861/m.102957 type:complete len:613 (-) Transcript_54861:150-1988(-)